jgi:cell division protein FtsB
MESPVLRKIWHSTRGRWMRFLLLAFVVWSVYSLVLSPHGWLRLDALRRDVSQQEEACAVLAGSRDSLNLIAAELDRGEEYILERRAREDFGFARPNERIYMLPQDAEDERCIGEAAAHGGETFSQRATRVR